MARSVWRLIFAAWLAVLAAGLVTADATAQEPEVWRLVAHSDLIVVGKIEARESEIRTLQASNRHRYVAVRVDDVVSLRGEPPHHLAVQHYLEDRPYAPSSGRLIELSGRRALLFLLRIDGDDAGVYFAGNSPNAIILASAQLEESVRQEFDRQARVLRDWRADPSLPHFESVRRSIERVAALKRTGGEAAMAIQEREFRRIEELGLSAVPAIVALMDDRRALAFPGIRLVNRAPDAFEGFRHYGPKLMVDVLSAILNQITGEHFRFIYSGGTEQERAADVNGWRIYVSRLIETQGE